jgi:hypothetical protein
VDVWRRTALTRCSRTVELGGRDGEREGRRPGEESRGEESGMRE